VNARRTVLVCDEDHAHSEALACSLLELGYAVEVVQTYAEAFAIACAHDLDAMVVAPCLRDGSALVLPTALGIRRPPIVILVTSLNERLAAIVARRVGFDVQLTKVVDGRTVDAIIRFGVRRDAEDGDHSQSCTPSTIRQ
jgi:DNA-binding response OmpR family regulator